MNNDKLQPGRDLDALIAEKIFNWEWWRSSATGRRCIFAPGTIPRCDEEWFKERADGTEVLVHDWPPLELPRYSTDMGAAWRVVEKLNANHEWDFEFSAYQFVIGGGEFRTAYSVRFSSAWSDDEVFPFNTDESPMFAICMAALEAVEGEAK